MEQKRTKDFIVLYSRVSFEHDPSNPYASIYPGKMKKNRKKEMAFQSVFDAMDKATSMKVKEASIRGAKASFSIIEVFFGDTRIAKFDNIRELGHCYGSVKAYI